MVLDLHDICKSYLQGKEPVPVLHDITLQVDEGEYLAIMGPSGSGKTTLMNILGGLDTPDFGGVWIRNTSLKDLNKEERTIFRRRNIGFVFQQYNLIPSLSIRENIVLPMRLDGKEIDVDFFNEIVEILGLKDKLERLPSTLSGGQQQRVSIARALLTKPAIVLADEPTGNLDAETGRAIVGLLHNISRTGGSLVLMTTHNLHLLHEFPGQVYRCAGHQITDVTSEYSGMMPTVEETNNNI